MALPSSYKQSPMQPGSSSMMGGMHQHFNILKERLRTERSSGGGDKKDNSNPFIHSPYGNPAFMPQKSGKASATAEARIPKPPKAPEKPLLPYLRYSRKMWDVTKAQYPDLKLWEISKIIGAQWRELGDDAKQEYISEYETDKVEYEKQLKTYHASPAYLAYLQAKSKKTEEHEPQDRRKQQDRRIDIQPAEDEDEQDDGFSVKHVAYARYLRNHRLINEIFSDTIVPDVRSVVTTQRMHVLKRQVQSLAMHQMKLQAELQQIEEKFETKKRKFVESSESFQEELKRHCKPAVDDDKFKQMVERQYELLKKERQRNAGEDRPLPMPQPTQPPAPEASQQQRVEKADGKVECFDDSSNSSSATTTNIGQPTTAEAMEVDTPQKSEDSSNDSASKSSTLALGTEKQEQPVTDAVSEIAPDQKSQEPVQPMEIEEIKPAGPATQDVPVEQKPPQEIAPVIPKEETPAIKPEKEPTTRIAVEPNATGTEPIPPVTQAPTPPTEAVSMQPQQAAPIDTSAPIPQQTSNPVPIPPVSIAAPPSQHPPVSAPVPPQTGPLPPPATTYAPPNAYPPYGPPTGYPAYPNYPPHQGYPGYPPHQGYYHAQQYGAAPGGYMGPQHHYPPAPYPPMPQPPAPQPEMPVAGAEMKPQDPASLAPVDEQAIPAQPPTATPKESAPPQ